VVWSQESSGKKSLKEFTIKNISIDISSFKMKFQSLPFFTWAVTDYIRTQKTNKIPLASHRLR